MCFRSALQIQWNAPLLPACAWTCTRRSDQSSRAIGVGLDYLRHLGVDWSPHPTEEETRREYQQIWSQIGSRTIEELLDLPMMSDPASLATLDVLTKLEPPALFTNANLYSLIVSRAVNLSIEHGNCDGSCFAYVRLGMDAGARFGDYRAAYRFGSLGYDLVEQKGLTRYQARTYMLFGAHVVPGKRHVRAGRDVLRRAFDIANRTSDLIFAGYSCFNLTENLLAAGDPLIEVQREAEHGLAFARNAQFEQVADVIASQLALVRMLRGLTRKFGSFDDDQFDELRPSAVSPVTQTLAFAECWYWIRKLQAHFHAGAYASAVEAASRTQRLWGVGIAVRSRALPLLQRAFARCLLRRRTSRRTAAARRRCHCASQATPGIGGEMPGKFREPCRAGGCRDCSPRRPRPRCMRLYQQAIRSARANGFVHNEALAYELAARFYAARGFERSRMCICERALRLPALGSRRQGAATR